MNSLYEYQKVIKNDDDLNRWRETWDGVCDPPIYVHNYMNKVVLPRLLRRAEELLYLPSKEKNENF